MKIEPSNTVGHIPKAEQNITEELQSKGLVPFSSIVSTSIEMPYKNEVRDVRSSKVAKVIDTTAPQAYKKK